jgi:hypothetical protein
MASPSYSTAWRRFVYVPFSATGTSNAANIKATGTGVATITGDDSYITLAAGTVYDDYTDEEGRQQIFSNEQPNALVTGIQYRIPMVFRQSTNDQASTITTFGTTLTPTRYVGLPQSNADTRESTGTATEFFGNELFSNYDSGGPGADQHDPLNYTQIYGGEGEFFGWDASNPITYYAFMGIEIKLTTRPNTDYYLAIGGELLDTYGAPAMRLFYKQPSITITTGKLNITDGKTYIGYQ